MVCALAGTGTAAATVIDPGSTFLLRLASGVKKVVGRWRSTPTGTWVAVIGCEPVALFLLALMPASVALFVVVSIAGVSIDDAEDGEEKLGGDKKEVDAAGVGIADLEVLSVMAALLAYDDDVGRCWFVFVTVYTKIIYLN